MTLRELIFLLQEAENVLPDGPSTAVVDVSDVRWCPVPEGSWAVELVGVLAREGDHAAGIVEPGVAEPE